MKLKSSPLVLRYILSDLVGEILLLPFWWYTIGLARAASWCAKSVKGAAESTGFLLWLKNLFVPMYGETGFTGRTVSFFVRLVMVIFRGIATALWMVCAIVIFALYLVVLPLSVIGIFYHGVGMVVALRTLQ